MTAIVWDQVGERRYETGIDRGVLYIPGITFDDPSIAVPWNGLVSVVEKETGNSKPYFLDGIKYMERYTPGAYEGTIEAYTYPDQLDELLGNVEVAAGARIHDQRRNRLFNLTYRTRVGNDLEGADHDYKIHLVWGIMASPSDRTYGTIEAQTSAPTISMDIKGIPQSVAGFGSASHMTLEAGLLTPGVLDDVEATLYGTADSEPSMPSFAYVLYLLGVGEAP